MQDVFAVSLDLNPIEIGVIIIAGAGFLIMFALSSAKGGYQDLVTTTLENDKTRREIKNKKIKR